MSKIESVLVHHTNKITPKLLSSFIDEHTNKEFLEIFDKYCNGDKPITNVQFDFYENKKIKNDFESIVKKAYDLLCLHDFNINGNRGFVELWKYTSNGSEVSGPLTMHIDDNGGVGYAVETCIFYLDKDNSVLGGGLYYVENIKETKFLGVIPYYETETKYLDVSGCMIVLLNGNLYHRPKSISGFGTRKCIVVQFESLDRN